ncbi:MAG: hypothetical protein ACXVES_07500 [Actinomycetota bacterium]
MDRDSSFSKWLKRRRPPEEYRRRMIGLTLRFGLVEAVLIAVSVSVLNLSHGAHWALWFYLSFAIIGEIYMWVFIVRFVRLIMRARKAQRADS